MLGELGLNISIAPSQTKTHTGNHSKNGGRNLASFFRAIAKRRQTQMRRARASLPKKQCGPVSHIFPDEVFKQKPHVEEVEADAPVAQNGNDREGPQYSHDRGAQKSEIICIDSPAHIPRQKKRHHEERERDPCLLVEDTGVTGQQRPPPRSPILSEIAGIVSFRFSRVRAILPRHSSEWERASCGQSVHVNWLSKKRLFQSKVRIVNVRVAAVTLICVSYPRH